MRRRSGASRDPVTGLDDVTSFIGALGDIPASAGQIAIAIVHLRELRSVNGRYGYAVGDQALVAAAQRLRSIVPESRRLARYHGPAFIVVFEAAGDEATAQQTVDRLVGLFAEPFAFGPTASRLSPTVACCLFPAAPTRNTDMVAITHLVLSELLDEEGPAVAVVDTSHVDVFADWVDDEELRVAYEQDRFRPLYQPIVNPRSGGLRGLEALIRLVRPPSVADREVVLEPRSFLRQLERSPYAALVGARIVDYACFQGAHWSRIVQNEGLAMFVNIGGHQLSQPDFVERIMATLDQSGLSPPQLWLDLEGADIRRGGAIVRSRLHELRSAGVRLVLNGFGLGHGSLETLRSEAFDAIRLPAEFTNVDGIQDDRAIVAHVTNLAHELGLKVIAGFIERREQLDIITELGVDLAQGFLFGRPEPPEDIGRRFTEAMASS